MDCRNYEFQTRNKQQLGFRFTRFRDIYPVCWGTELLLGFYPRASNYWHYVTKKFPRELFRDVYQIRYIEVLKDTRGCEYSKKRNRKGITLSKKKKVYKLAFNDECNYIAGEPFKQQKSLDLVSEFDNSKHLCMENKNSCFVLLEGFWSCVCLLLSCFIMCIFIKK